MKKECIRCYSEKDLSKFHINNSTADGRRNICTDCVKGKKPKFASELHKNLYLVSKDVEQVSEKDKEAIDKLIGRIGSMKSTNYKIDKLDDLLTIAYKKLDPSLAATNTHYK